MNYLLFFFLLTGSLTATNGRPSQMEESNDSDLEETEYESDGGVAPDESLGNDDQSRQNDAFSDYKTTSRDPRSEEFYTSNDEYQAPMKTHQSNRISESDDSDANNYKPNRKQNNVLSDNQEDKIMIEPNLSNEEDNLLFNDNREQISKITKTEYNNNEASDSSEQSQYFKQYYNTMQAENKGIKCEKSHENTRVNLNRDRRQLLEPVNFSNSQNAAESVEKSASEDEVAAIKSHIKKLSSEELEDLLNSLSEEKRALLKKIIDNDADSVEGSSDNISKREITKKALEENNFIENAQSESSKILGGSSLYSLNTESAKAHHSETTEITKQPDNPNKNNDLASTQTSETNISENAEINSSNDDSKQEKPENIINTYAEVKNTAELVASKKESIKKENKRETNLVDFNTNNLQDPSEQGCFCSRDEDMSQLIDEEAQLDGNTGNNYKRQVVKADSPDSIRKNLEESFPNSEAYDETGPYSYSGPLIRVKRTNPAQAMKKRAAGIMPNANVAYVPYRAENDDEDNDEGNEFDDDGFYDRTSHFANGNNINAMEENSPSEKLLPISRESKENDINLAAKVGNYYKLTKNDNMESDTMSLGSDTDSVLSGVEGVDDNLMYSSGVRKRRTADDDGSIQKADENPMHPSFSTSLADDVMKGISSNAIINAPNYQESDPFGPLPRMNEGDLGRYKRIRRVKQSHTSDEIAPSV